LYKSYVEIFTLTPFVSEGPHTENKIGIIVSWRYVFAKLRLSGDKFLKEKNVNHLTAEVA
jgi:hypothetical protein